MSKYRKTWSEIVFELIFLTSNGKVTLRIAEEDLEY